MRFSLGGIYLSATGYIQIRAYTSKAQIPLQDVAIRIMDKDGKPIAYRLTNRSGQLDKPIPIPVPDIADSQTPGSAEAPYEVIAIYARLENFEQVEAENIQVFANVITVQDLEMIPLSELPENWNQTEIFITPPQNL